jgi:hypothetical protein
MRCDKHPISNGNPMEAIAGFSRTVRMGPSASIGGTAPVWPDGNNAGQEAGYASFHTATVGGGFGVAGNS